MEQTLQFPSQSDTLTGTLFAPEAPSKAVLLNGATGVPHGYYQHFARWLRDEHNAAVLTYDYSGFGASLHGPMSKVTSTMSRWAITDQLAARACLLERYDLPLTLIGHSVGALCWQFMPHAPQTERAIAVCSGPINHRDHPMPYKLGAYLLWFGHGPLLAASLGYLPGTLSGLGTDVPASVFWQWRRWCTTQGYHATDPDPLLKKHDALTVPLRSIGVIDDETIPEPVVAKHHQWHPKAPHTHVALNPKDYGLGKVGHLAAFTRRNAALWPELIGGAL